MPRRTAEQELAYQMQKMKDMGVTVSVQPTHARTAPINSDHPMAIMAEAAKAAGIYEEKSN